MENKQLVVIYFFVAFIALAGGFAGGITASNIVVSDDRPYDGQIVLSGSGGWFSGDNRKGGC
jgi:hypothetical protein